MNVYRGPDLDLRTPQHADWGGPAASGEAGRGSAYANSRYRPQSNGALAAIWVDQTVLACCNHAHDVAVAHGAAEVRLEHLVHAMTRVDAAARVLEERGIHDAALRTESAAIIASQVPVARPGEPGTPRASLHLDDVLRRASELSSRSGAAAGVADVLRAMMQMSPEVPGVRLLLKHAGEIGLRESGTAREIVRETMREPVWDPMRTPRETVRETVREPVREVYREPIREVIREPVRETIRETIHEPTREIVREPIREEVRYSASPRYVTEYLTERRAAEPVRYTQRFEVRDEALLDVVAQRVEVVEQLVRNVQADAGSERRLVVDHIGELQRDLAQQRNDAQAFRTAVREQIGAISEQVQRLHADTPSSDPLLERIAAVERAISSGMGEGARNWAAISDRMKALERSVLQAPTHDYSGLEQRFDVVEQHFDVIEQAIRQQPESGSRLNGVDDRLQMMSRAIGTVSAETTRISAMLAERDPAILHDRLRVLETQLGAQRSEQAELRTLLTGEIKAIERAIANQPQSNGTQVQALVNERFQTLGRMLEAQRGDLETSLRRPFIERIAMLEANLQAERSEQAELAQGLAQMMQRVHAVEGLLVAGNQRQAEAAQSQESNVAEIHEALIKLGSNQQTLASNQQALAGTFDEWRQERSGDLAIVDNHLKAIEAEARRPVQLLEALSSQVQTLQQVTIESARKRSWIKMWLFGTDEVWEASWGSPKAPSPRPRST